MFIREILPHHIDIIFVSYMPKCFHKVWLFKISVRYLTVIILIQYKEYSHHDCVGIPILEFRGCLQEFKTRVSFQKVFEQRFEIVGNYELRICLCQYFESPFRNSLVLKLIVPEIDESLFAYSVWFWVHLLVLNDVIEQVLLKYLWTFAHINYNRLKFLQLHYTFDSPTTKRFLNSSLIILFLLLRYLLSIRIIKLTNIFFWELFSLNQIR